MTEKKASTNETEVKAAAHPAEKTAKPAAKAKAAKPAKPVKKAEKAEEDKVYHISKRKKDRMWQVKAEGSPRALKLFFTQAEAVDYAKSVAGNNEGRIVIHKEDGSFRKLSY